MNTQVRFLLYMWLKGASQCVCLELLFWAMQLGLLWLIVPVLIKLNCNSNFELLIASALSK